jgi:poly(A) polymerase
MVKLAPLFETRLRTKQGSVIRRYKDNVGKLVGSSLYVHKDYADQVIPKQILKIALDIMTRARPEFRYNTLMWDVKRKIIRFDEASDFDKSSEPHVGDYVVVSLDGSFPPREGHSDSIWHHKWLWVKDDYRGFDVDKSKEWSKLWLAKLEEPAKGTDLTWQSQLRNYGIIKEVQQPQGDDMVYGGIWSNERIVAYVASDKTGCGHTRDMGPNRWLYIERAQGVFWHIFPPFDESQHAVENYLEKRGYDVKKHYKMQDYYRIMGYLEKKKKVTENELLMEARAKPKDLEAFLREQIKGTEWEGKVFLVGGFVRDELLGKEPKDADIVVGKYQGGVEFTTWLGRKLGIYKESTNPVIYPTFGTANLRLDGVVWNNIDFTGESVDAVMFRKEQYHDPNSRKPTVQYTDKIEIDASRRDLTFNALYKDVSTGNIIDPTGTGMADLRNGIIRTPIDPTIIYTDDALRMFRAVRFATQLGFKLAPEVIEGIKANLHRLGNTSKERIRDELNKILVSKDPTRGIRLLKDTGLLPYVSQELQQAIGMTQNVHHVHDVFDHTLEVLKSTKPELVQRLMALFHDIGKTVTRSETPTGVHFYGHEDAGAEIVDRVLRDLKYPTDIVNAVKAGVANHMRLKHGGDDAVKLSDKSLRKFKIELGANLESLLDVIHADNIAHADASAMPNQIEKVRQRLKTLDVQVTKPVLPINGNDLQAMGVPKGPQIGKILAAITDAWFENPNITRDEAIAIAKTIV